MVARLRGFESHIRSWRRQLASGHKAVQEEAALHALICPPSVLAAQLDRLAGVIGLTTVELGIIPLSASLKVPPATAFWIYDDRQVIVENWHVELWIDDEASVDTYLRTWRTLRESAVYGVDAQNRISAARRALGSC